MVWLEFQETTHRCRSASCLKEQRRFRPTIFAKRMNASGNLHFKTYFSILIMVVFGPLGNVLLGKGMKHIGTVAVRSPGEIVHTLMLIFSSSTIWLGIASLITFFIAYTLVLSWADYSYVQPASSMAYGVAALLAHFLLREVISPTRWLGVTIICLGVFVVSATPPRTLEHPDGA
jgi:drug/metabolite transporter (DMT)-like permease